MVTRASLGLRSHTKPHPLLRTPPLSAGSAWGIKGKALNLRVQAAVRDVPISKRHDVSWRKDPCHDSHFTEEETEPREAGCLATPSPPQELVNTATDPSLLPGTNERLLVAPLQFRDRRGFPPWHV